MIDYDWSVLVCKYKSENSKVFLVDLYRYVEYLVGVKSLHFIIRDRVDDDVIFSFRIQLDPEEKRQIEDAITLKLRNILPTDCYTINPGPNHPLCEYVAWPWRDRMSKDGQDKFTLFCSYLTQLSRMVVEMAEKGYFDSKERVEMAHLASCMLGCTEYGLLSTKEMQVGYYDRINGGYHSYLSMPLQEGKSGPTDT